MAVKFITQIPSAWHFKLKGGLQKHLDPKTLSLLRQMKVAKRGQDGGRIFKIGVYEMEVFTMGEIRSLGNIKHPGFVHLAMDLPPDLSGKVSLDLYVRVHEMESYVMATDWRSKGKLVYSMAGFAIPSATLDEIIKLQEQREAPTVVDDGAKVAGGPNFKDGFFRMPPTELNAYQGHNRVAPILEREKDATGAVISEKYHVVLLEPAVTQSVKAVENYPHGDMMAYNPLHVFDMRNKIRNTGLFGGMARLGGDVGEIVVGDSVYGITGLGRKRTNNEDSILAAALPKNRLLLVVCDGMGGHGDGEIASKRAALYTYAFLLHDVEFADAIISANLMVHAEAMAMGSNMGTTIAAALIEGDKAKIVHAGDARVYIWRGGQRFLFTRDHSYVRQMHERQSGKLPIPLEGSKLNAFEHAVLQAKGVANRITSAIGIMPEPEIISREVDLLPGDQLLLGSDGWHGEISPKEANVLASQRLILRPLVETMFHRYSNARKRGKDNVSILGYEHMVKDEGSAVFESPNAIKIANIVKNGQYSEIVTIVAGKVDLTQMQPKEAAAISRLISQRISQESNPDAVTMLELVKRELAQKFNLGG